jgi:6-phospho-3-hexuloisomerase
VDPIKTQGPRPWVASWDELAEVAPLVDRARFDATCELLSEPARRWFFAGQGRSGHIAAMAAMRLMHLGRETHVVGEASAPALLAGDGLVMVSGSGATPTSVHQAVTARKIGAVIIGVSRVERSPLADVCDVLLVAPAHHSDQLGGNLFEHAALLLLDSVVNVLGSRLPNAAATLRSRHANLQ